MRIKPAAFVIFSILLAIALTPTDILAWPIPDTGQTKCYNNNVEIPCPTSGQAFYGQDGNYNINPPSYTKLDASGNVLADDSTHWAMIRDNVTRLIWENKTDDGSIHDGSKTFTWCDRNSATNGGNQGTCGSDTGLFATDTEAFIKTLNDSKFGGYSNWRVPTIKELSTIISRQSDQPSFASMWFPSTMSSIYWSSNTNIGYPSVDFAWGVDFFDGYVNYYVKTISYAVRAVRSGGPTIEEHFVLNGDGTITDTFTGLMWQQKSVSGMSWEAALSYAAGSDLAGYNDWRLPNVSELQSIADYSHYTIFKPAIDPIYFPGTVTSYYCTSTSWGIQSIKPVQFESGAVLQFMKEYPCPGTRAVRGGQSLLSGNIVISKPAQADYIIIGEQETIFWNTADIAGNVKITLSRQGGKPGTFVETIVDNLPNTGGYNWTVTGPEAFNCALRIEPVNEPSKGTTQSLFTITTLQNIWISTVKSADLAHYQLTLNGQHAGGVVPLDVIFSSSDPTIATIDSMGLLTALRNDYIEVSTTYTGNTYKKGLFVYTALDWGESEPNADKAQADSLMIMGKSFYQGTLPMGDVDWFKFTIASPSLVHLGYLSKSNTADVKIELFDSADVLMASYASQNGESVILPVGLPGGDYYLRLSPDGDIDQTESYVVTYKIMDSIPAERVTSLGIGETRVGTINNLADKMEFTFDLPVERAIILTFTPTSSSAKYHLDLLDSNQKVIDQIDSLDQRPVNIEAICATGNYSLRVMPAGMSSQGGWVPIGPVDPLLPFNISLAVVTDQVEKEPNDAVAQATAFDISRTIAGRISSGTDTDFYVFHLDRPRFLELNFAAAGSDKHFVMTLHKESDQDEIDGINIIDPYSTSWHMGLSVGRYYLKVTGDSQDTDTVHPYTFRAHLYLLSIRQPR